MHWSYKVGIDGIQTMTKFAKQFTRSATILGLIVVGALIASYVGFNVALEIPIGETSVVIQEVLDGIMPCLLPLCVTFMMYGLVKKNVSPLLNIGLLVLIGLVGARFGIFA